MTRRRALLALAAAAAAPAVAAAFYIPGFLLPVPRNASSSPSTSPSTSPSPSPESSPAPHTLAAACGGGGGRGDVDALVCSPHDLLGEGSLRKVRAAAREVTKGGLAEAARCAEGEGMRGWAVRIAVVEEAGEGEARRFAHGVLERWAEEGECVCGDGVVLVVAVKSQVVVVEAGEVVERRLGAEGVRRVEEEMRRALDAWENYGVRAALVGGLRAVRAAQGDAAAPRERMWVDRVWDALHAAMRVPLVVLDVLLRGLVVAWEYFPLVYLLFLIAGALLQCLEPLLPERFVFWRRSGVLQFGVGSRRQGRAAGGGQIEGFVDGLRHVTVDQAVHGDGAVFAAPSCAICLSRYGVASPGNSIDGLMVGGGGVDEETPLLRGEELRALSCGHVLHRDCIVRWLTSVCNGHGTPLCPICRSREPLTQV